MADWRGSLDWMPKDAGPVPMGFDLVPTIGSAGELDEVLVHVAPVLLGAGTPAFLPGDDTLRSFDVLERSGPQEMTTLRLKPR
jgi:hypothetical protein